MTIDHEDVLSAAAGALIVEQRHEAHVEYKKDAEPVTDSDLLADRRITELLQILLGS